MINAKHFLLLFLGLASFTLDSLGHGTRGQETTNNSFEKIIGDTDSNTLDTLGQVNRPQKQETFTEMFEKIEVDKSKPFESMTLNQMEQTNNPNNFDYSHQNNSEVKNAILILILIGFGIFLLGVFSNIKRPSLIKLLASFSYRFSSSYKKDKFIRKAKELRSLLDSGIISQSVYDSRMEDILKDRDL